MAKYAKKSRKGLWIGVLVGSAAIIIAALAILLPQLFPAKEDLSGVAEETSLPTQTEVAATLAAPPETEEPKPDNPIDWEYYQDINEDVYAWIFVPETGIDLPVLQSQGEEDDNFYLHHDINKNYLFAGEVYSQKKNAKDFSDPVTVLYGHNMKREGERFTNLLYFQDEDFFNEVEFFYIYTPERILTYRIVSAHSFDTRHILKYYDNFSTDELFQKYLDVILKPPTFNRNVREGITLTTEDRIVTLSTCINHGSSRFLIQGVLISDEVFED